MSRLQLVVIWLVAGVSNAIAATLNVLVHHGFSALMYSAAGAVCFYAAYKFASEK